MLSPRTAVTVAFALDGAVYGCWAARVPALAQNAGTGPGGLGLALLGPAVAMVLTASPAGWMCARLGARRTVCAALGLACWVLPGVGLAGSVWSLGVALALLGGLMGAVDVGVNVAGVAVVRALDRPLMPSFHAAFSAGGLCGAAGAWTAATWQVPPWQQFTAVGGCALVLLLATGRALPGDGPDDGPGGDAGGSAAGGTFREVARRPLLWLLACVALCAAVAEGACAEWSAVFLVDERGADQAAGAVAYGIFTVAVALARLAGERMQLRYGGHRVLAAGGVLAALGVLCTVAVPGVAGSYAGFAVAGAGLASCFPVALGLAGDAGAPAGGGGGGGERELGFVTTVAYAGLLGGPPLIGSLAQAASLSAAMGAVALVALLVVPATAAAAVAGRREAARRAQGSAPSSAQVNSR